MERIGIEEGRRAFGADPANYDSARPDYPERVFEVLRDRCGSLVGRDAFEIGAGTGLATRSLLGLGVARLFAIEPDERLAAYLRRRSPNAALHVVNSPFEEAELPAAAFDLGTAATSFHWLDQRTALAKVAALLKPDGWWVCWWNVFGDHERHDAFHEATRDLLARQPRSPSEGAVSHIAMPLDTQQRIADLNAVGTFEDVSVEILKWTLVLNPAQVRALYATYSQFSAQTEAERNRILDGLAHIAAEQFGGRVERNMCTAIYTARRTWRRHQ
jgi:trans-aconitate methyltransferase